MLLTKIVLNYTHGYDFIRHFNIPSQIILYILMIFEYYVNQIVFCLDNKITRNEKH